MIVQGKTGPFEIVIGLEIHAQILSKSKLFSGASTEFGSDPNTQVALLDAGLPGMLPVLNTFCVDQAIKTGLGIHGTINELSVFDRKNYFYPDLPLGYQISQFTRPIVTGGYIDIDLSDGTIKRINVTRIHMEMDAGKSIHDLHPKKSFIDLNRAGIALMEIVSEPDMRSPEEAMAYVKKMRTLVRYLETCDGNMEQGNMRVDANISLRRPGGPLGTRAEIKNVNSVRFLGQALEYEINRQMNVLDDGGEVVQETRLFDAVNGETRSMRSKEDAHDYRYFPDPDLLPLRVSQQRIESIRQQVPELPDDKKNRFITDLGLSPYDASVLTSEREIANYYESVISHLKSKAYKNAANWLLGDVFAFMNKDGHSIDTMPLKQNHLAELVDLIENGTISGKIAKDVFAKLWETGDAPSILVEKLGLQQVSDEGAIRQMIEDVLKNETDNIEQYRAGKIQVFGHFVGQVMKVSKGKANPALVNSILKELLK
jgi:aspartyl-tRNA(Asn)/glutamyl-tRNA(Gln) amidotransferase subunit B